MFRITFIIIALLSFLNTGFAQKKNLLDTTFNSKVILIDEKSNLALIGIGYSKDFAILRILNININPFIEVGMQKSLSIGGQINADFKIMRSERLSPYLFFLYQIQNSHYKQNIDFSSFSDGVGVKLKIDQRNQLRLGIGFADHVSQSGGSFFLTGSFLKTVTFNRNYRKKELTKCNHFFKKN